MRTVAVILIAVVAAWMVFDGTRALTVGSYVTPSSGPYAGQLGPWAALLAAVGIEPRSTAVAAAMAAYGLAVLASAAAYAAGAQWARRAVIVVSLLGLWYAPFGTAAGLFALAVFSRKVNVTNQR
jgi:hypothetical protein